MTVHRPASWLKRANRQAGTMFPPGKRINGWGGSQTVTQPTPTVSADDYSFYVRPVAGGHLATVAEFPDISAHAPTDWDALLTLHRRLDTHITELVAAGTQPPPPAALSVDPDHAAALYADMPAPSSRREKFAARVRHMFARNTPRLHTPRDRKATVAAITMWGAAVAAAVTIVFVQSTVATEAVGTDAFAPIVNAGALVKFADPVPVESLSRGDRVRVVRADGLVEYGLFDEQGLDDTVVLFSPQADDRSEVVARDVHPVDVVIPMLGRIEPALTSPALAVVPLAGAVGASMWGARRRARATALTAQYTN